MACVPDFLGTAMTTWSMRSTGWLVTEHLGIRHLRLVIGFSMGGM